MQAIILFPMSRNLTYLLLLRKLTNSIEIQDGIKYINIEINIIYYLLLKK